VAIIYRLAGTASRIDPGRPRRPVGLFDRLPAGVVLETEPGARLELAFGTGLRWALGSGSRAALGPAGLATRSGDVRQLLPVPPLPLLGPIRKEDHPGRHPGAVRIRGERITGLYPGRGAAAIASAVVLRFLPVGGTERYQVELRDEQGTVIFSATTSETAMSVQADFVRPGTRYHWTVRTVERAGPVALGEADFMTLPSRIAEERETLRKAIEAAGDSAALALLAEVDRELGLVMEAQDELRAAVRALPGDAQLAAKLAELERLSYFQSP
jgi:hypothetical protein